MKVWGCPQDALYRIVRAVSSSLYEGNVVFKLEPEPVGKAQNFTLTVRDSRGLGARIGRQGRRIAAACWHVHRDVFTAIYADYPEARIKTVHADYRSKTDFEADFPDTGFANIGSLAEPLHYQDACECGNDDD